jgi:hypothetical protein
MSGSDPTPIRASAEDEIRAALDNPVDAPFLANEGDTGPELGGGDRMERPPFPPGCPVTPLGIASDISGTQKCYYLNWNGQLVGLEANNRHGKLGLIALFGPASDWLEANFPQWSKPVYEGRGNNRVCVRESEIVGFDQAEAARALIEECVRRGIFDPAGKMRGAGAHRQRGGGLALHCGDKLLVSRHYAINGELRDMVWLDPGQHDGHVYTAAAKIPRPSSDDAHPKCAEQLLALLMSWHWKRPLLDPRFLLGAIGASMIGGWLPWRPNVWITGQRGTGKSTINGERGVLDELFGEAQFRTANASAAAIRQTLKNSTVPVMFDELEASDDNRRVLEVVELARIASSGGKQHRGGQDQVAHEFTLRSAFWFSSINMPPLQAQDRSRLAILELKPLEDKPRRKGESGEPPNLPAMNLPRLGELLLRRMVDGFPRFEATKIKYHAALAAQGHGPRACDQFGTLLAGADVLLHDWVLPDDEEVAHWASLCRPDRMAEIADDVPDHVECLHHILSSEVQARGGDERVALGSWIGQAVAHVMGPLLSGAQVDERKGDDRAEGRLQQLGLKLVNPTLKAPAADGMDARWGAKTFDHEEPGFLAIADRHQGLDNLFRGKKWQSGVWRQSLARYEGAIAGVDIKFGHVKSRAVLVPLWQVLDEEELPNASRREACEAWLAAKAKGGAA